MNEQSRNLSDDPARQMFARFAWGCLKTDGVGEINGENAEKFVKLVKGDRVPPYSLLGTLFPTAIGLLTRLTPNISDDSVPWPLDVVTRFCKDHKGIAGFEQCSTVRATVKTINVHSQIVWPVETDCLFSAFIDLFNLRPRVGDIIYAHKGIIFLVEQPS